MIRSQLIEQIIRQVYGTQPSDDASITPNLVNQMINQGIGLAVKQLYRDSIQLDGIGYINNSFYTTFKAIPITLDEQNVWKVALPEVPLAVGKNEGVSMLKLKSSQGEVSMPIIWLTQYQVAYYKSLPIIPNKTLGYYEGNAAFILSTNILNQYTASVTIVSGGDSTNLSSTLNIPADYIPIIVDYVTKQLMLARQQIQDVSNDGSDAIRTA